MPNMPEMGEPYVGMPIYLDDEDICDIDEYPGNDNLCESTFEDWPLAMAYVPWQQFNKIYAPKDAFMYGTIFSELNLPFLGGAR